MAGKRKQRRWFWPSWLHKHLRKRKLLAKLRELHGDDCWLCGRKMRFEGLPNRGKAATIEHYLPTSRGGTWALDNLRLCHVGCNRHLGDRTPQEKERMRINLPPKADAMAAGAA